MSNIIKIDDRNTSFKNDVTPINDTNMNTLLNGIRNNKDSIQSVSATTQGQINDINNEVNNVNSLINMIEDKDVKVRSPKFTITLKNYKGTNREEVLKDAYEFGTKLKIGYKFGFDAGQYKYNASTGVTPTSYKISVNGQSKGTVVEGEITEFNLSQNTNITTSNNYSGGIIPISNLGREVPDKQIKSESYVSAYIDGTQTTSFGIYPFRMGCFFGGSMYVETKDTITSDKIRDLKTVEKDKFNVDINKSNKAFPKEKEETITFTVPAGTKSIVVACPKNVDSSTLKTCGPTNALNVTASATMHSLFGLNSKLENAIVVKGANGEAGEAYNVWIYTPAIPYEQPAVIKLTLGYLFYNN